jgi:hypothetical protein
MSTERRSKLLVRSEKTRSIVARSSSLMKFKLTYLGIPIYWIVVLFAYLGIAGLYSMYRVGNGDEGLYLQQVRLFSNGEIPTVDFWATHPAFFYAYYLPFSWLLGPGLETARLLSLASMLGMSVFVALIVRRHANDLFAISAFLIVGLNSTWLLHNAQLRHSVPANLGLLGAYFFISRPGKLRISDSLLAGLFVAIAANTRVVFVPLVLVGLVVVYFRLKDTSISAGTRAVSKTMLPNFGAYFAGILIVTWVNILTVLLAPSLVWHGLFGHRLDIKSGELLRTEIGRSIVDPFGAFTASLKSTVSGDEQALIAVAFLGGVAFVVLAVQWLRPTLGMDLAPRSAISGSVVMIAAIVGCYALTGQVLVGYLHHVIPFTVIGGILALASLSAVSFPKLNPVARRYGPKIVIAGLVIVLSGIVVFHTASATKSIVGSRYDSRAISVISNWQVACWLNENTSPDDTVLTWGGYAVALADRNPVAGYEQSHHIASLLWGRVDESELEENKLISPAKLESQLRDGSIAVVLDEKKANRDGPYSLIHVLDEEYVHVGDASGYKIYMQKSLAITLDPESPPDVVRSAWISDLVNSAKLALGARPSASCGQS